MSWNEITPLVERAKGGDREAFGELVTRFQGSVYAMALARGSATRSKRRNWRRTSSSTAMKKLPQLRDARCFAGWLRQITARMAINRLTRKGIGYGSDPGGARGRGRLRP